ncbi:MAG: T9SS type A sorting domain-containing protein [Candidatus Kapabacteria bacterium]|nr:T9SS type A sorting domain-containing protein [Candidatus Kapabacteria bacterium]
MTVQDNHSSISSIKNYLLVTLVVLLGLTDVCISYAQTHYIAMLRPRRVYNQLHVEIWLKATSSSAPRFGYASFAVKYDPTNLTPVIPAANPGNQVNNEFVRYLTTDSIDVGIVDATTPATAPVRYIPSATTGAQQIANVAYPGAGGGGINGYLDPQVQVYGLPSDGVFSFEVRRAAVSTNGAFVPDTVGRGTFVGKLIFSITGTSISDTALARFQWNNNGVVGPVKIFAHDSLDITNNIQYETIAPFPILGTTVLYPNGPANTTVDRDRGITNPNNPLQAPTINAIADGWPIYFERSVDPSSVYHTAGGGIDPDNAYLFEYSLNSGSSWTEFGRIEENAAPVAGTDQSGEIEIVTATSLRLQNGAALPADTAWTGPQTSSFAGPLLAIWRQNRDFQQRSENARIRITALDGLTATNITARSTFANRMDMSDNDFVLGRLFFVQLDGASNFLRSRSVYVNSTQLTVEAWVNLNEYKPNGSETGIVAFSGGPNSTTEGTWMLYLKDGRYPAFRAREIEGRGPNGYIADVWSKEPLPVVSSASLTPQHLDNWHHLAATVNNNVVTLYLDGEIIERVTNTNHPTNIRMGIDGNPGSGRYYVGINPNPVITSGDYLNAGIKGARVWRTALHQDSIRQRVSGLATPSSVDPTIPTLLTLGLDVSYTLEGSLIDQAINPIYQFGIDNINLYTAVNGPANDGAIRYRPDLPHIRLTSPTGGEGISNNPTADFEIRWVGYGIGVTDVLDNATTLNPANGSGAASELMIEYSINSGASWSIARNTLGATAANKLGGDRAVANNIPLELGKILWRPFNSNGLLPDGVYGADANVDLTTTSYSNPILVRIRGNVFRVPLNTNNPDSIYGFTSSLATLAPYSAISGLSTTPLVVSRGTDLNFSGQTAFFEAWIRPYQFPTGTNKLPILVKKDSTTGQLHYALRLLSSGQLEFSVRDTNGTIRVAVSDSAIGKRVLPPNFSTTDSTWTHVGAFVNLANGGQSQVVFYIDGVPQNDTVITNKLGSNVRLNTTNTFPTYIGFEPGTTQGFVGQMREVRMWNGTPGASVVPAQVANRDQFIQGALTAKGNELATTPNNYTTNLAASFNLEQGGFVNGPSTSTERYWKSIASSNPNVRARFIGTAPTYTAQLPFIKLVEPTYKQLVRASATNVKVRWVGFNYDNATGPGGATNGFYEGGNLSTAAGITAAGIPVEYSLLGGGGNLVQPYQPVSTTNAAWGGAASNAFGLVGPFATTQYVFAGSTGSNLRFAGNLNASIADPDFNNDGTTTDAGRLSGAPANGRLRLRGVYSLPNNPAPSVFDTAFTQGPLFDVAPSSNFSVRVALEGRHNNLTANAVNLPATYNTGGTKIYLYADNGGIPGALVDSAESTFGYGSLSPTVAPLAFSQLVSPPPAAASEYVTIPHVFSTLTAGNYWVVVQHLNHLPVMSRFPARFNPIGDNYISYLIESGWDFLSWNGANNTVMTATQNAPIFGNYVGYGAGGDGAVIAAGTAGTYARGAVGYSAYGQAISTTTNINYSATGLIFNDGISGVIGANSIAAMVGGNVVKDNQINAADVVRVQARSGSADVESDVTGDGTVNASDRNIVQRNFGKSNSIQPLFPLMFASNTKDVSGDENAEAMMVASENPELFARVNALAADYINNGKVAAQLPYKQTNQLMSNYNFVVSATPVRLGNFVEVPVYVRNVGQPWAMANATFALGYNSAVLDFVGFAGADQVLFSNKPEKGYVDVVKSAPDANTPNPLANIRTIEVNYDAFSKRSGEVVPNTNSYLGTLRFEIKDTERPISFNWEQWASAIYETQGNNITSNADFKPIPALLSYTANIMIPDGGERWRANRQYNIEWSGTSSATVRIEYSLDGGQTWNVIGEAAAQDRQFAWTTPVVSSSAALIRVVDKETGYEVDRSASTFRIQNVMADISKPSQMDPIYRSGSTDLIRWSQLGLDNVRFEFSSNDGVSWVSVSSTVDATTGQVSWVVPAGVTTKTALVRMIDLQSGDEMARSSSFKVLSGNVDLLDPTMKYMPGTIERVRWTSDITNFDLQYSLNGGVTWVDAAKGVQAAKGWFDWTVPMANTLEAKLRAILVNDPEMEYDRTINFTIGNPTSVGELKGEVFSITGVTPNPMMKNGVVKVMNTVPQAVTVSLMNSIGQTVEVFHNEMMLGIGEHSIVFDVSSLPNGTYYIRVATGDVVKSQSIVIQR